MVNHLHGFPELGHHEWRERCFDLPCNTLEWGAGVHNTDAFRLRVRERQICGAHPLEKGFALRLKAICRCIAGAYFRALQAQVHRKIEQ